MISKPNKQILFETRLQWLEDSKGILSAKEVDGSIQVSTPVEFGGEGKQWTPEHFFLHAVSSCFMTTLVSFARKFDFEMTDFSCQAIGTIELVEGKYKFTSITLYPKVYINNEAFRESIYKALEKTYKYCIITNSINVTMAYHSQVINSSLATSQSGPGIDYLR